MTGPPELQTPQARMLEVQQVVTTLAVSVLQIEAMYMLTTLAAIPLMLPTAEPSTDEIAKEFKRAGKKLGLAVVIDFELDEVAVIPPQMPGREEEMAAYVNPELFVYVYGEMYGDDWSVWKRMVTRVLMHEREHRRLDVALDELGYLPELETQVAWSDAEGKAWSLLEDYYVEHVALKGSPIRPPRAIRKGYWEELRAGLFDPKCEFERPVVLTASSADINREFADTPIPRMKALCEELKVPGDVDRLWRPMTRLYEEGLRQ